MAELQISLQKGFGKWLGKDLRKRREYFRGYYFKHQKNGETLSLICGFSNTERFIQIITGDFSAKIPYTKGNLFSDKGIVLNIKTPEVTLTGRIRYGRLTPLNYDIMGPFQYLPMECSHGILSMEHSLCGKVCLNGKIMDFTGGTGYMEMDRGRSFPSEYTWIQANDFAVPCSIMAATAEIPVLGARFRGCISVIRYRRREIRLATYLGAKVRFCSEKGMVLEQGRYRLEIRVKTKAHTGRPLSAPNHGEMTRTITESVCVPAEFVFYIKGTEVFHLYSKNASYEYEQ